MPFVTRTTEADMSDEERDARWQEIMDAQADFVQEPVPLRGTERSGPQRRNSKSRQFDEALSSFSSWSSVEPRRRRLSA
jgi:hypothetical protein